MFAVGGGDVRKVWKDVTDRELRGKSALNSPRVVNGQHASGSGLIDHVHSLNERLPVCARVLDNLVEVHTCSTRTLHTRNTSTQGTRLRPSSRRRGRRDFTGFPVEKLPFLGRCPLPSCDPTSLPLRELERDARGREHEKKRFLGRRPQRKNKRQGRKAPRGTRTQSSNSHHQATHHVRTRRGRSGDKARNHTKGAPKDKPTDRPTTSPFLAGSGVGALCRQNSRLSARMNSRHT